MVHKAGSLRYSCYLLPQLPHVLHFFLEGGVERSPGKFAVVDAPLHGEVPVAQVV